MFVHTMLVAAAEGAGHEPHKDHNEWMVGIVVMIIFIVCLMATLAFQKDR